MMVLQPCAQDLFVIFIYYGALYADHIQHQHRKDLRRIAFEISERVYTLTRSGMAMHYSRFRSIVWICLFIKEKDLSVASESSSILRLPTASTTCPREKIYLDIIPFSSSFILFWFTEDNPNTFWLPIIIIPLWSNIPFFVTRSEKKWHSSWEINPVVIFLCDSLSGYGL